jgi:hypothetical protein
MATVEELSGLHQRYLALSNRFKAVWTFHQFLQGLSKILADEGLAGPSTSFQALYGELKSLAKDLNSDDTNAVSRRLDDSARRLDEKTTELIRQDLRVSPGRLRQFFDRVRSYDRRILIQLLRAYLYIRHQRGWSEDLVDKADFLVTRLGDEFAEGDRPAIERDHRMEQRDIWRSLWLLLDAEEPATERVEDTVMEVRTLREAMAQTKSLDQFNELGLIAGYRRLKHSLGDAFFYPPILDEVVRTNLYLRSSIGDFFEREEQRIAGEYQEVFELEREALQLDTGAQSLGSGLDAELQDFRGEVQRFESQLEKKELRLDEVARLRARARDLIPRLQGAGDVLGSADDSTTPDGAPDESPPSVEPSAPGGASPPVPPPPRSPPPSPVPLVSSTPVVAPPTPVPLTRSATLRIRTANAELLGDTLRSVLAFLERTSWEDPPEVVAKLPDLNALRLEPREILAFRRLHSPESVHLELEQFLFEAAALRVRVTAQAEEMVAQRGGLQTEAETGSGAANGRVLCHLAGQFERRLDLFVQEAVQSGDAREASELQHLRMRLLREYSGLWLLVYG